MAEHREALCDGLRPPDDVEDEVEPLGLIGACVRGTEAPRRLELALVEVERVDLRGPRDPGALNDAEPDGAAADHSHPGALPDLGRLQHRADAGGDGTAEQAGLLGGQLDRQPDKRRAVKDAPRGEGSSAKHPHQVTPIPCVHPPRRDRRRAAELPCSAQAPPALAARRPPADDHSVAGRDVLDSLTHGFDDARSLVAEEYWERVAMACPDDMEIRVADPRRLDSHARLARARLVEVDLLDAEPVELGQDDAAIHDESRSRARFPPRSARVRSVSAIRCRITVSTPSWPPTASP
jgi:hypothetical protein